MRKIAWWALGALGLLLAAAAAAILGNRGIRKAWCKERFGCLGCRQFLQRAAVGQGARQVFAFRRGVSEGQKEPTVETVGLWTQGCQFVP